MKQFFFIFFTLFILGCGNSKSSSYKKFIPLYSSPSLWYQNIDKLKNQSVIINPDEGAGKSINEEYLKAIKFLKQNNVTIYGYVYTNYMNRNINEITNDIDNYKNFYPQIDGIFFDETATNKLSDYEFLADYVHNKGFNLIALNPGSDVNKSFFDCKKFDIIVTLENDYKNINFSKIPKQFYNNKTKSAALIYDSNTTKIIPLLQKKGFHYIYITPDTLPNPWKNIY